MLYPHYLVAALTLAACALAATPARAACFPCDAFPPVAVPRSDVIAADGVLALNFSAEVDTATIAEYLTLTVRDADDVEVLGEVVVRDDFSTIFFRPTDPWIAGAQYTVTADLDRGRWGEDAGLGSTCETWEPQPRAFTVDPAPLPPQTAPPIDVVTEHRVEPLVSLETLVCCDDAYPAVRTPGQGACPSPQVDAGGICHSRMDLGELDITYDVDLDGLAAPVAGNIAVRLLAGDKRRPLHLTVREPTCLRLEILDLARGTILADERCLGDDLADQLGELDRDPTDELAGACEGKPYVCDVLGDHWDPDHCRPWPELTEASEPGCGCNTTPPTALTPWLAALLLARRRRHRSPRT